MSLTIERLNRIAEDPTAFGSVSPALYMELVDYARERAAREKCEALLPENWMLRLDVHADRLDFYTAIASYSYSLRHYREHVGPARFCPFEMEHEATPTEAYLALAEVLAKRG